ncbi:hypothetical protein MNBD_GAMMA21-2753 [hydrothermal vent metagenome]|uniref:N-acetyltransferase domain-containing protein n=1 Tax=hydrothermal vent metagenome TaxID=652676 RepID=A0A3B1AG81_9ZZZZ
MIKTADTIQEIEACYTVMVELRPHLSAEQFLNQVQMQKLFAYQLSYLLVDSVVVAVAGHRMSQNLAWGKFCYVDDLITAEQHRSKGYGKQMLDWLIEYARQQACQQIHLDSGKQRKDAHRFYEREGLTNMGHHYSLAL